MYILQYLVLKCIVYYLPLIHNMPICFRRRLSCTLTTSWKTFAPWALLTVMPVDINSANTAWAMKNDLNCSHLGAWSPPRHFKIIGEWLLRYQKEKLEMVFVQLPSDLFVSCYFPTECWSYGVSTSDLWPPLGKSLGEGNKLRLRVPGKVLGRFWESSG